MWSQNAVLRWAPVVLASTAGAGYVVQAQPAWRTGGSGDTPWSAPMMSDVVPTRAQQLTRLRDNSPDKPFDVLIIGGGATGTGCAVDAATRGLRTALVERADWASGTSSKSTKLVHGGVRYLEKAVLQLDMSQLKLVYEALHERKVLLDNAPHLSHPLPILTPCYKWWEVPYFWAGMKAYDLVAGTTNLIWSKYVGPTETLSLMPTLAPELRGRSLKGSILYYDGQFDDARLAVTLACSAAAAGAAALNYMNAKALIKNEEGKVVGVQCEDALTGQTVDVYARVVINATGPFLDGVRRLSDPQTPSTVRTSAGAHVTLPGYFGSNSTGIIIPKTPDGRVVFLLPFQGHVIAGTTDIACEVTPSPRTTEEELSYILAMLSDYLGVRVSTSDVLSTWSGIRPLPSNPKAKAKDTASVVRDHVIFMDDDGLLNVTGGKWTTYRRMAEETVDAAMASGRMPMNTRACATHHLPLLGATKYKRTLVAELAQQWCGAHRQASTSAPSGKAAAAPSPISLETVQHLVGAYGDRAALVLALASEQPALGQPLVPGHPFIQAEVVYCTQHEYCMTVEDFLSRRTRLAFLDLQAARAAVPKVAALMAPQLGWSDSEQRKQVDAAHTALDKGFTAGPAVAAAAAPAAAGPAAPPPAAPQQQQQQQQQQKGN